jgi:hypothetical protein
VGSEKREVGIEKREVGIEKREVGIEKREVGSEKREVGIEKREVGLADNFWGGKIVQQPLGCWEGGVLFLPFKYRLWQNCTTAFRLLGRRRSIFAFQVQTVAKLYNRL